MLEGTTEGSTYKKKIVSSIILASSSPRRQELIQSLGLELPIDLRPSNVDESYTKEWSPDHIVEQLSLRKAQATAMQLHQQLSPDQAVLVIGSDTIVVKDNEVLGKPVDEQEASRMLGSLQGRAHQVYTGLACLWVDGNGEAMNLKDSVRTNYLMGRTGQFHLLGSIASDQPCAAVGHTVSEVTFREMSDQEIADYTASGYPLDKAGAYGIQGIGAIFIERIEGDFYSVMGLPINLLYIMLKHFGIHPLK